MADWTADSGFGATRGGDRLGRSEPVLRGARGAETRAEALRAERLAATRDLGEGPRSGPGAAALARYNAAMEGPLAKARVAVWAGGGVLSLALMAGIGVWGYKLVMREVMGLPVVEAEAGPMRIVPADPGGQIVPQQGLAVNAIPAAGVAAPPSDVLVLAPQTPGLAEEDMEVVQTMAEAGEVVPVATAVAVDPLALVEEPALEAASPAVATVALAEEAPQVVAVPTTLAPAATLMEDVAGPLSVEAPPPAVPAEPPLAAAAAAHLSASAGEVLPAGATGPAIPGPVLEGALAIVEEPVPVIETPAPAVAPVEVIPASVPGVVAALRPAPRPASLRAAAVAPATAAAPAPTSAAPASGSGIALTADLPAGTNLVQLGAFDSPEIAASEWERLQGPFGEFLGSKERVIQETQSNGRTLYRLRATGFADRAEARALCAALTAEDAACIPVTVD